VERAVDLPSVLPTSGTIRGSLVGNLTLHGVTRSTTWTGTATLGRRIVTVVATTPVTLTSFNMSPPQVGPVSVDDVITLDINARLTRTTL
jgi:polyisoprenoid-binding protein YceI